MHVLYLAALCPTHTLLPAAAAAAALTFLPSLHSTASLNVAILAPVGPTIELWSPLGHIYTTGPVMKLWIFHRSADTYCLLAVNLGLCSTVLKYTCGQGRRRNYLSNSVLVVFNLLWRHFIILISQRRIPS